MSFLLKRREHHYLLISSSRSHSLTPSKTETENTESTRDKKTLRGIWGKSASLLINKRKETTRWEQWEVSECQKWIRRERVKKLEMRKIYFIWIPRALQRFWIRVSRWKTDYFFKDMSLWWIKAIIHSRVCITVITDTQVLGTTWLSCGKKRNQYRI